MLLRLAGLAAGLLLLAPAVPLAAPPSPTALITPHGLDLATLDRTCEACDDFYAFAEGNYARLHPIPADRSRTGAFDSLMDQNRQVLERSSKRQRTIQRPRREASIDRWEISMRPAAIARAACDRRSDCD